MTVCKGLDVRFNGLIDYFMEKKEKDAPVGFVSGLSSTIGEKLIRCSVWKRASFNKWKSRYLILDGRVLKYWKSKDEERANPEHPAGRVVLDDIISLTPTSIYAPKKEMIECAFQIEAVSTLPDCKSKLYYFCCLNETEKTTLVGGIFANLRIFCSRGGSVIGAPPKQRKGTKSGSASDIRLRSSSNPSSPRNAISPKSSPRASSPRISSPGSSQSIPTLRKSDTPLGNRFASLTQLVRGSDKVSPRSEKVRFFRDCLL